MKIIKDGNLTDAVLFTILGLGWVFLIVSLLSGVDGILRWVVLFVAAILMVYAGFSFQAKSLGIKQFKKDFELHFFR
ncbi:hypothetical protein [Crenobacter cavernae]|uniref:hypothetical protein n=1 Tax=Crenobacter cavernae TaxID=2290923 RepID=UPI00100D9D6A|nr:hypothetical protein [Crenobacter cavernae]